MEKYELHYERTDLTSLYAGVYTKDFNVGETITWLGHDGVYGYLYGEEFRCDEDHYAKRTDFPVYRKIGKIHISKLGSDMKPRPPEMIIEKRRKVGKTWVQYFMNKFLKDEE